MTIEKIIIGAGIGILVLASLIFFAVGVKAVTPGAGMEAVMIHKPILFGHGGVNQDPVRAGREYTFWTTEVWYIDMRPQQYTVHFEDLMSMDGVPLDFDAVIRLKITNSVDLVKSFGPDWYRNNVEAELRNRVRQAVRKHGMNETAIDTKAIDAIDKEVSEAMAEYLINAKLPLNLIDVTVGKANPPDSIKDQRVETATQQQRVLTEYQRKLAEDSRRAAEKSRAAADNAYREAMQLSPEQFLRLETIKMQEKVCDGGGNCTFVIGASAAPIIATK
ncbi:MAG: SPFH domain-containing protein [Patescibacteria group bacterium]